MSDRPNTHVIMGNGHAGTAAAEAIRKRDSSARIILIGNEAYPLYNRIALPPFLKSKVTEQKVMIRNQEWHNKLGIELRLCTTVERVNTRESTVTLADGEVVPYDRLLIATGGTPNRLPAPGGDTYGVFYFQTLDDSKAILQRAEHATSAAVTGGSYISYELTEAFARRGLKTTWIMRGPWFLRRILDEAGGRLVDSFAAEHDVQVVHNDAVAVVESNGTEMVTRVRTVDGKEVQADLLGCGLGLQLNTAFLAESGIEVRKGVVCDRYLETNVPGVFAAGDVAEFYDVVFDRYVTTGNWYTAGAHGKVAGANMAGDRQPFEEVGWYASTLFDSRIEQIGMTPEGSPDLEAIAVSDGKENYRRAFFEGDRLVGLVAIGDLPGRKKVSEIIRTKQPIEGDHRSFVEQLSGALEFKF